MILSATLIIQPLPPVPMATQSVQMMRNWAQKFGAVVLQLFSQTGDNNGKSWKYPIVPLSERNSAG